MSKKIIGVTVGTTLPKPNFEQTDPTKGDYIRNKPDFDGLKGDVEQIKTLVGDTAVSEQINSAVSSSAVLYSEAQELTDEQKEIARANIGAIDESYVVIEPLPISSYVEGTSAIKYNVNVEDLTVGLYAVPYNKNYSKQFVNFFVLCDDGTEKSLFNNLYIEYIYEVYSVSAYAITIEFNNTRYVIDIADKSTSDAVTLTKTTNYNYLDTKNGIEYTPTGDYNPATKKYVDDSVATLASADHDHNDLYYTIEQIDAYEFITTDDIDTICGAVTEEGLPQSDIDELMASIN